MGAFGWFMTGFVAGYLTMLVFAIIAVNRVLS